jgi:hypothetical protein
MLPAKILNNSHANTSPVNLMERTAPIKGCLLPYLPASSFKKGADYSPFANALSTNFSKTANFDAVSAHFT